MIQVTIADLTEEKVDAIVNSANPGLSHDTKISSLVEDLGGREVEEQSDLLHKEFGLFEVG
jgi:O-acetyl-ADP-ribose deacetylase (regulator of RNase III)